MEAAISTYAIDQSGIGGDASGDAGAAGAAGDGSAVRDAVVTLVDSKGNQVSGFSDSKGRFLLRFSSKTFIAPLVLRVVDAGGNVLASVTDEAVAAGKVVRANINPLTDKITSDVLAAAVSGTDKTFDGSKIDVSKIAKAKADVVTSVNAALVASGVADTSRFDPVKSVYAYDGTGVDTVIESISHARDPATGATQLRAKLAPAQLNAEGTVIPVLITASTPLATAQLALSTSTALTFAKLTAWVNEMNRCMSISGIEYKADANCVDADGSRLITTGYRSGSLDFEEDFRTLRSNSDRLPIQGSTIRNPLVLFTTKYPGSTATFDDLAVVEFTVRQPFTGPLAGSVFNPVEYTKTAIFKRDDSLTRAKAGNWILHGNQRNYQLSVYTRYVKAKQMNPAKRNNSTGGFPDSIQSRINLTFGETVFDKTSRTYVPNNVRAVRVKGPGLTSAGVVLVSSSAVGDNNFAILNKTGSIPTGTASTTQSANSFGVAAVAFDGSALFAGYFAAGSATNVDTMLTDFSSFQANSRYTFEIFLNSNTTGVADAVESTVNLAPVYAPSAVLAVQLNDPTPSEPLVTAPAPAATSVNVQWINNYNAAPINDVQMNAFERNPKGSTTTFTATSYDTHATPAAAYSLTVRPSSQVINAPSGSFPSLNANVAGDFRLIGIWSIQGRYRVQNSLRWDN